MSDSSSQALKTASVLPSGQQPHYPSHHLTPSTTTTHPAHKPQPLAKMSAHPAIPTARIPKSKALLPWTIATVGITLVGTFYALNQSSTHIASSFDRTMDPTRHKKLQMLHQHEFEVEPKMRQN